jgi:predicted GNAT superfamily acetyltransferase
LARGISVVTWTFDPLVSRNAYFNLAKLGARATRYLVDFYGDMVDGVNAGQGSDRLWVEWRLDEPPVAPSLPVDDGWERCPIPADIDQLRRDDPDAAIAWRYSVRESLTASLAHGYRIAGFRREDGYLLEPPRPA